MKSIFLSATWSRPIGARSLTVALLVLTIGLSAGPAMAQTIEPDPPTNARVRIGPLQVSPAISLTNIGVDQNVFNEPPEDAPKQDFTATIQPTMAFWLNIGRARVTASVKEQIIWYQKYSSERAANTTYATAWHLPLNRLVLQAGWKYAKLKDRPGFEIDTRSQRSEVGYNGAVEIRALSKTLFGVTGTRESVNFASDAIFRGVNLHDQLNSVSTTLGLTVRHELTPLTSVSVNVTHLQDRFDFSPLRDADSTGVSGAIAMNSFAVIKGTASFGYRDFKPASSGIPGYQGTVGAADLSYTLLGATRFAVAAKRDVQYSYDNEQPYYIESGFDLSVAQQVFGPFDVVARFGNHNLAYRTRLFANPTATDSVDNVKSYGAGAGLHLGKELRLGFNVDRIRRDSDLRSRRYENLRFGSAITYGF
jgi:hypothetical protein